MDTILAFVVLILAIIFANYSIKAERELYTKNRRKSERRKTFKFS